ncbi:MAG TPA: ABC transporter ATP-binding protein [Ferruginibacter sp.]|nr:ABC transporter ATP-binding protein [Ferruginibacter sp.]
MVLSQAQEIAAHLQHNDVQLAVRRMLDLSLESNDSSFMRESIAWSKQLSASNGEDIVSANFLQEGHRLIEKATAIKNYTAYQSKQLIKANGISKKYSKGNFYLKPVSLSLTNGQITGIVGENGNGKTTLLRCLSGQLAIDGGSIDYSLLNKPDYYNVKHYVAFIPQRIPRWYGQLKDNLHFSAAISGLKEEENELMVDFMLERLGLTKFALLNWEQISSGYRTRFELARILLQKPQLLILDEPLANLDIKAQQTVLTDLQFIAKSAYNPMGIILSSQQLHEVEKVADDVIFIRNGESIVNATKKQSEAEAENVLEIESTASREQIAEVLKEFDVSIGFNGGFYTISSPDKTAAEIGAKLFEDKVTITYFRDITHSTKRYFN